MLPIKAPHTSALPGHDVDVQPGSWWRLTSQDHSFAELQAPAHGLVLMVREARFIDGALHTVVLHPHPMWMHAGKCPECKILIEDFLTSFRPEPEGAALREAEIANVLGRIEGLTKQIASPPEPMTLLEKQTEDKKAGAAEGEKAPTVDMPVGAANVPAALLPGQDVIAAQAAVETRIAAFEAQRHWIEGKTDEMKSEMALVGIYQTEKVNGSLASISQETKKAEGILANVQTMRLFLGEDMSINQLRDGKGAASSEPLTFMQRLLFLDEEIFVSTVLDGFNADMMSDLPEIFEQDFSLVERMLPTPRCVAIVRVRRNPREIPISESFTVADLMSAVASQEADKRIHILVRDGERVHMITADEATSNAQRLFPSREEIDALFTDAHWCKSRAITPTDIDYTDARAKHDTRALFYKRFLIILWGAHERSDIFGAFLPQVANWLQSTIHSDRFRFIHDEENVLTEGRMAIQDYIEAGRLGAKSGSRVIVKWREAMTPDNAPKFCTFGQYNTEFRGALHEAIGLTTLKAEGDKLVARAPVHFGYYSSANSDKAPVTTPVILSQWRNLEQVYGRPERLYERQTSDGWICLDDMTLKEVDAYIASREARQTYDEWLALFVEARALLASEKVIADQLAKEMGYVSVIDRAIFDKALKLWREANKWGWPESDAKRNRIRLLFERISNPKELIGLSEMHRDVLRIGLKATGDVFVIEDDRFTFSNEMAMPWLTETTYSGPGSKKAKSIRSVSFFDLPEPGYLVVHEDRMLKAQLIDRLGPLKKRKASMLRSDKAIEYRDWQTPRGLGSGNAKEIVHAMQGNADVISKVENILEGKAPDWAREAVDRTYEGCRIERGRLVELPEMRLDLGILLGKDARDINQSWVISLVLDAPLFAWMNGQAAHVENWIMNRFGYVDPERALERLKARATTQDPVRIVTRPLEFTDSLKTVSSETFSLSFDERMSRLADFGIEGETDLSWIERAATRCVHPKMKNNARHYPQAVLREAAQRLSFIGSDEAEAMIEAISRQSFERKKG